MNEFDEVEYTKICEKFSAGYYIKEVVTRIDNKIYFSELKKSVTNDRRGEVCFCVIRPNSKIIVVTCEQYPEGVFRIPTGGIGYGEDIVDCVLRETKEELGLDIEITDFIGVIKIRFEYKDENFMFYTYMFILKEAGGNLLEDATDDEISEVKEVTLEELLVISNGLKNINGAWHDWGTFRYLSTNTVLNYLLKNGV